MKKTTIVIQGLLSVSLFSLIRCAQAQESVSSFEQSIINHDKVIQASNDSAEIRTHLTMEALSGELKARGWEIQQQTDGSIIMKRHLSSVNTASSQSEKNISVNTRWQQLKQKFQKAGWSAELDNDGAMHLTPPGPTPMSMPQLETTSHNEDQRFKSMQKQLEKYGWNVTNNADGSMLLYPPEINISKKETAKKLNPCPGEKFEVDVLLPVDSWQEAHDIAHEWLKKESIAESMVGKIRKIFNVYIISIVSAQVPYKLMHQIAIKNTNGAVIILN